MRTVTVDIINEGALNLLKELELMKLIRLRKSKPVKEQSPSRWAQYKGAMTKEPLSEVDHQLNQLRNE